MAEWVSASLRERVYDRVWGRCQCAAPECRTHDANCGEALRGGWLVECLDPGCEPSLMNLRAICRDCGARRAAAGPFRHAGPDGRVVAR